MGTGWAMGSLHIEILISKPRSLFLFFEIQEEPKKTHRVKVWEGPDLRTSVTFPCGNRSYHPLRISMCKSRNTRVLTFIVFIGVLFHWYTWLNQWPHD